MPILHKISDAIEIDKDRKILYVRDITGNQGDVFYTKEKDGTYTSQINSTGYGGSNPPRTSLSLFLLATLKTTKGDINITVLPYNPETVSSFEVQYNVDGWYQLSLIAVPFSAAPILENYYEGSILYSGIDNKILKVYKGLFTPIEPKDLLNTQYKVAVSDIPIIVISSNTENKLSLKLEQLRFHEDATANEIRVVKDDYDYLRISIRAAIHNYTQGHKFVFQKIVEHIQSNYNS